MSRITTMEGLLRSWLSPRLIVTGPVEHHEIERLARFGPGMVAHVSPDVTVTPIEAPPLHIHINGRKPRRTASMGPTMRRRRP